MAETNTGSHLLIPYTFTPLTWVTFISLNQLAYANQSSYRINSNPILVCNTAIIYTDGPLLSFTNIENFHFCSLSYFSPKHRHQLSKTLPVDPHWDNIWLPTSFTPTPASSSKDLNLFTIFRFVCHSWDKLFIFTWTSNLYTLILIPYSKLLLHLLVVTFPKY